MTTTDVQISVEQMLAASTFQLVSLLVGATERNNTQAIALEAAGEQLREHAETRQRNRAYIEDNDELRLKNRKLSQDIARLSGDLESTTNALDIRGRAVDNLHKQIEALQAQLAAVGPKVGDRVRVKDGAQFRDSNGELRPSHHVGYEGELKSLDGAGGNAVIDCYLVQLGDLEVIS